MLVSVLPAVHSAPFGYKFREEHGDAIEDFDDAVQEHRNAVQAWVQARQTFWQNRNNNTGGALVQAGQDRLMALNARIRARIELMQTRVEATEALDEEAKDDLLGMLDEYIAWYEDKTDELGDAETAEEQGNIWREMIQRRENLGVTGRYIAGDSMVAVLEKFLERAGEVMADLQDRIDELEADGEDVSDIQDMYDELQDSLDAAEELKGEAQDKFAELLLIADLGEGQDIFRDGVDLAHDARQELRGFRQGVKDIIQEMRALIAG